MYQVAVCAEEFPASVPAKSAATPVHLRIERMSGSD
jgi:hypothetical protein